MSIKTSLRHGDAASHYSSFNFSVVVGISAIFRSYPFNFTIPQPIGPVHFQSPGRDLRKRWRHRSPSPSPHLLVLRFVPQSPGP
ncbi:hypothetical protein PG984_013046 [Apiospora sp. TS-2023a]